MTSPDPTAFDASDSGASAPHPAGTAGPLLGDEPLDAVDLVLALVAARIPPAPPPGLDREVDWDRFLRLLKAHGIQGLAMATHRSDPFLPESVARRLEEPHVRTALHTTLTVETGARARRVLGERGIPALLFKGAALVEAGLYRDPGARAMGDADLLVRPDDAHDAVAALREEGFDPWSPWDPASAEWLDSASLSDLRAPDGVEVSLDLHWRLGYERLRYGRSGRGGILWEGADLDEGRPADSTHLVVLLEHLLKHLHVTSHVRGIGDAVRLSDSVEDWESVWDHLTDRPTGRALALLLDVLRTRLGAAVPSEVGALAERGWWRSMGRRVLDPRRMVMDGAESSGSSEEARTRGLLRRWAVLGSPRSALREALHTILPGRGWLRARYDAPAASRFRLLFRYWKDVTRWLRGRGSSPVSPNQGPW
ncbi:MAG: nucleotidyltransferase family protein [Longimicrobiales bacterium]|nr:nucleotidyltransferase family protein [Longimicrobiales bacterium]